MFFKRKKRNKNNNNELNLLLEQLKINIKKIELRNRRLKKQVKTLKNTAKKYILLLKYEKSLLELERKSRIEDELELNNEILSLKKSLENKNNYIEQLKDTLKNEQQKTKDLEVYIKEIRKERLSLLPTVENIIKYKGRANYVYILTNKERTHFKIGRTKNDLKGRHKAAEFHYYCKTGKDENLTRIKVFETENAYLLEPYLHNKFKNKMVVNFSSNEWFHLDTEDLNYLLNDGYRLDGDFMKIYSHKLSEENIVGENLLKTS